MNSEAGGAPLAGCTTLEEEDGSPCSGGGPRDGPPVETAADVAATVLTTGVDTATQTVGLVGTAVTAV